MLFEPIRIGHLEVKNRIAFAPTHMGQGGPRGEVTDQSLCHYSARAKGGVGLVITEAIGLTGRYAFSIGTGVRCSVNRAVGWERFLPEYYPFA
jgi:2,4-dienoyl-CoA reductase-like NADH-dependent reductase (Old Yellow Enzyme family)